MIKRILILIVLVVVLGICLPFEGGAVDKYLILTYGLPNNCIEEIEVTHTEDIKLTKERQAVDYASNILIDVYGESVKNTFPLQTQYDDKYDLWIISGCFKDNVLGGVPYIGIMESTGEVVYISHSE